MNHSPRLVVSALALLAACTNEVPDDPIASVIQELSGREGKIDFEVDAPWRIEPVVNEDDTLDYGPIPIQITISDAHLAGADDYVALGDLIDVTVQQYVPTPDPGSAYPPEARVYQLEDLAEIEIEGGPWPYTGLDDEAERTRPVHLLCEPWKGQNCSNVCDANGQNCADAHDIGASAKWYATAWYDINQSDVNVYAFGADVPLEVTVRVQAQFDEDGEWGELLLRGSLLVHLGEEPLPSFGRGWVYGDLHYHSQGTHNEGESGHPYRAVVRAMGTMGLGFAFATDHASYSEQLVDLDLKRIEEVHEYAVYGLEQFWDGLRDMSPERFRYANERINDPGNGANHAATDNQNGIALQTLRQSGIVPTLFLGAEVDAAPETTDRSKVEFGNGLAFSIGKFCQSVPGIFEELASYFLGIGFDCETEDFTEKTADAWGSYYVKDWQGDRIEKSRQHVLHLPTSADPEAFVPSRTSRWGGGTRRIDDVLGAIGQGGVSFLAHPLSSQDSPHPGPNVVPYGKYSLLRAFDEPTMLGLQIWNGDGRLETTSDDYGFINTGEFEFGDGKGDCTTTPPLRCTLEVTPADQVHLTRMWEWAQSTTPTYGPMEEPFAPAEEERGLYASLHHGAYTWDRMNMWGMDSDRTKDLYWLPPGEPRRVFASGGSDAHGDFNYRRSGYFFGTDKATTTAIGTPRNLVDLGLAAEPGGGGLDWSPYASGLTLPTNITQKGVTDALKAGRFSVTDGPALRIVVDLNRNGLIDADDMPMGGIVNLYGDDTIPLLVDWKSTTEFGPVDLIQLYVGSVTDHVGAVADGAGRVYAAGGHGVRDATDPSDRRVTTFDQGKQYYELEDSYFLDPTAYGRTIASNRDEDNPEGILTIRTNHTGGEGDAYGDTIALEIDPADFPAGDHPTTGMFIRAFARTAPEKWRDCDNLAEGETLHKRGKCLERLAYTNPIWAVPQDWVGGEECPEDYRGIDGDGDGHPDGCDYCPNDSRECGPDTPERTWARGFGGTGTEIVEAVTHDRYGNVVVAGHFSNWLNIGGRALLSDGAFDGFIAKLSRTGELMWLRKLGGSGNMRVHAIAVDDQDVVTVAGWFQGRLSIDNSHILNATDDDMFVISLTGGEYSYVRWMRQLGGAGRDVLRALAIGPDGSIYAAGAFSNELMSFHGGRPGEVFPRKTSTGGYDCVMMRFMRADGRITGSRQLWGAGQCAAEGITVQANHDVVVAGRYNGEIRIDPSGVSSGVHRSRAQYNGFVAKFRPLSVSGSTIGSAYQPIWNQSIGDTDAYNGCLSGDARVTGVAEQDGALVAVGHYKRCAVARNDRTTIGTTTDSNFHGFAVTLNSGDGDVLRSSTANGIGGHVYFTDVSATVDGVAISGAMTAPLARFGNVWFGGWSSLGSRAALVAVMDEAGVPSWAKRVGGTASDYGYAVSLFRDGFVALAGQYQRTLLSHGASPVPSGADDGTNGFAYQTRP